MSENYLERSIKQSKLACELINKARIIELWQESGAKINLVGSLKIGVLAKHRDIDFHVYTDELDLVKSFEVVAKICKNLKIKECSFTDLSKTEEACFEWHIWCYDKNNQCWQIDLIQILKGSKFDGFFENIANQISSVMTQKQKEQILQLKFETPDDIKISGIEYYKAVIQEGISELDTFLKWHKEQNFSGIIEW